MKFKFSIILAVICLIICNSVIFAAYYDQDEPISINMLTINNIPTQKYTGSKVEPNIVLSYNGKVVEKQANYTITYKNNIKIGTATITITGIGNYTGTRSVNFKIANDIAKAKVTGVENKTYTGAKQTQKLTVKYGSKTLKNGTDYTVKYSKNINAGMETITITGKGNYTGTKNITFKIAARSITKLSFSKVKNYTYTGKAISPSVTVKYGKKVLVKNTDYTVSFTKNKNKGTATITIKGKGNYTGTKKITFKIAARKISSAKISGIVSKTYNKKAQTQSIKIVYKGITLKNKTDYTVSYKNNKNKGMATVTIKGKGNFTGSVKKTFKIKAKSISGLTYSSVKNYTYTGKAIKPSITVKDGSTKLKSGTNYTIKYSNNTKIGTATITITGKGNYTGTKKLTFKILRKENPYIVASNNQIYVGEIACLTLKDNTKKYTWKTSDKNIATVDSKGIVTGKKAGTVTLYAVIGSKEVKYTIKVLAVPNGYNGFIENKDKMIKCINGKTVGYFKTNSQFKKTYYDMNGNIKSKFGIDISEFQGLISWDKVKSSGVEFAIIRCGFRGYGTGRIVEDDKYRYNIQNALDNGIDCGVYFFTQAINKEEGIEEANYVLDIIKNYNITYPIVIDTEASGGDGRADNISKSQRTEAIEGFCETIKNAGYTPMIYASANWFNNRLDMSKLADYDKWLAHYTKGNMVTDYNADYSIWQYTSSGKITGISGNVDLDILIEN